MNAPAKHSARWFVLIALFAVLAGCQGPLLTGAYLLGYGDTQAEYKGLKGKRVVVVCRPLVELQFSNMNASKMITREVAQLLRKNVSQIDVVDSQKTAEWLDSNNSDEYTDIGRAFDADMVVGVDLIDFKVRQGQTLYRGTASYEIKVVDCETGATVFQKSPAPCTWPTNVGVPTSSKQESQFRRQYVGILAGEIARCFYRYDHRENFASDSLAFE